jgi:hypothetical protein
MMVRSAALARESRHPVTRRTQRRGSARRQRRLSHWCARLSSRSEHFIRAYRFSLGVTLPGSCFVSGVERGPTSKPPPLAGGGCAAQRRRAKPGAPLPLREGQGWVRSTGRRGRGHRERGRRKTRRWGHFIAGRWLAAVLVAVASYHSPSQRQISGARGEIRTRTSVRTADFKSAASAIPPPGHMIDCTGRARVRQSPGRFTPAARALPRRSARWRRRAGGRPRWRGRRSIRGARARQGIRASASPVPRHFR